MRAVGRMESGTALVSSTTASGSIAASGHKVSRVSKVNENDCVVRSDGAISD